MKDLDFMKQQQLELCHQKYEDLAQQYSKANEQLQVSTVTAADYKRLVLKLQEDIELQQLS